MLGAESVEIRIAIAPPQRLLKSIDSGVDNASTNLHPKHIRNLGLLNFLDADCRPAIILRRQQGPDFDEHTPNGTAVEYRNAAFTNFYTISRFETAFVSEAVEVVGQLPPRVVSLCRRISGHQCTCTTLSNTSVLVSWNAVPAENERNHKWSVEDQSILSINPPDIISNNGQFRDSLPSRMSSPVSEPWLEGARALGWTRYEDMHLTPHQRRIASYPWEKTSLGHISTWSIAHKLAVSGSCMNPNPRCLYWGPDLIALYNEPCIPIFGDKHPAFLGHNPAETWPETWSLARPLVVQAMHQGKPSKQTNLQLFINRKGFLEEAFFDSVWLPLPGVDSEDNGVLNQFTEITDAVIAKRHQGLITVINDRAQHVDNICEFWNAAMSGLQEATSDIAYALLFTPKDHDITQTNSPSLDKCGHTQYSLRDQIGFKDLPSEFCFALDGDDHAGCPVIGAIRKAYATDKVAILEKSLNTLPDYLHIAVEGRAFGDLVTSAAILPISNMHQGAPSAFVVIGLSPRRPLDDRTRALTQVIRDCLVKGAALANLPVHARRHQKQMDQLHQSLLSRLHESNLESRRLSARFQRISDAAPIGMFITSADGTQKYYVNDEYLKLLDMTREELNSGNSWLNQIVDEDVEKVKTAMQQTIVDLKPVTVEYKTKKLFQLVDEVTGQPFSVPQHLMVTCMPEFDEHGNVHCMQGWVLNVSQERFTQQLLSSRLQEVIESKQSAENFIDMVSHEMRNPLSAILQSADGMVSMIETFDRSELKQSRNLSEETVESVLDASQTIILCAQHMKRIVDDILTLSKLDANLLVISPDKTNPAKLLPKALKMFEAQLVRASIAASVTINPSVAALGVDEVMMDSSRILQIVINLLTNAIKFTSHAKRRAISLELSASTKCPADAGEDNDVEYIPLRHNRPRNSIVDLGTGQEIYLTFMVRDTGKGLTSEEKTTLFQRFSQASPKTYKKYGGSGLGLFISRELTELQGGQIGVVSEAGKGSTFAFYVHVRRWIPGTPLGESNLIENIHTPTMLESPVAYSKRGSSAMFDSSARSANIFGAVVTPPPRSPERPNFARQISTSGSPRSQDDRPTSIPPMSVLIVEDNVINQKVMAKQIRAAGHTVHVANHGLEALDFLRQTTFCAHLSASPPKADYLNQGALPVPKTKNGPIELDVILMDLEMPILDGLSCVRQMRNMQAAGEIIGHVPVIAVTANARSEQIATALAAGMDEVVTKPFRIWQVLERAAGLVSKERQLATPFMQRPKVLRTLSKQSLDAVLEKRPSLSLSIGDSEQRADSIQR
ncbi:hypothetical protein ANO11243_081530 [Dothideomycetidae sp. 11243]|nr:hypothetical protein ANO11243_081530 [fungal sp. No.11243]